MATNLDVVYQELLEAVLAQVAVLLTGSVADLGHPLRALESASGTVVNTTRLAPARL